MGAIRGALARHPEADGWVIREDFKAAYENQALTFASITFDVRPEDRPMIVARRPSRIPETIGGLPIKAVCVDVCTPATWATLVRGYDKLASIETDPPKGYVA